MRVKDCLAGAASRKRARDRLLHSCRSGCGGLDLADGIYCCVHGHGTVGFNGRAFARDVAGLTTFVASLAG